VCRLDQNQGNGKEKTQTIVSQTFENKLAISNQIHYLLVSIRKTQEEWLYYGKTKINVTKAGHRGLNGIMEWTQYHHF